MDTRTTSEERKFRLTPKERASWEENGYFIRYNVFAKKENDFLAQIADDIRHPENDPSGRKISTKTHWSETRKTEASGPYAMHCIHHINNYAPEFLERTRDPRLTDPVVDLIGPNILGLNNLYIWKPPKIGLGFPWHQDRWYFNKQYKADKTVGTWTAIDASNVDNGCLYVIPGSHKDGVLDHEDLEGSQQNEFKSARGCQGRRRDRR